jgi:hypothetical protein
MSRYRKSIGFIATIAGLALLLWMNFYLRHTLETADQYLYSFYKYFYPEQEKVIFSPATPLWKLFLPIPMFTGVWNTTTLVLSRVLEDYLRPSTQWYLFNALLITASFLISWLVFRSRVFSFTLAICMGFGTQLYVTYPNSGTISFPLIFIYYQLLLLSIYKLVVSETHRGFWKALLAVALLLTAVAYEPWLDLLVVIWFASIYLFFILDRMDRPVLRRRLLSIVGILTVVGLAHIAIKVRYGYGQTRGMESDVWLNYPFLSPKIEDFVSNVFTNLYMAVTNFLPPPLVSSTAFYQLGGEKLVELQHGYHAPFSYLVPMHYLFFWRYFAGALALGMAILVVRAIRRSWARPSPDRVALVLILIMVLVGGAGPTHSFIKFRPMNAMPVQTYHVLTGVLGMSLLVSLLLMWGWRRAPRPWQRIGLVAAAWSVIFYGSLARPGMISHQAAQSGLGVQVYPNPLATLLVRWGHAFQPPAGLALYQLMKYSPAAASVTAASSAQPFAGPSALLPSTLPDVSRWTPSAGVSIKTGDQGTVIEGNNTTDGYQITSPAITVPAHHILLVRLKGVVEQGRVCPGVLDETQDHWLVAADANRHELLVETGPNRHVWLTIANCNPPGAATVASRFKLEAVSYAILQKADGGGSR